MGTKENETSCIHGGKKIAVLFTVGILFVLAGFTCYPLIDSLIQNKINAQLVLTPTSDSLKEWKSPDVPIYLQFFIFNVENAYEAKEGGTPVVSQKGPYSYREHRIKENISWENENSTVTYNEKQSFVFDVATSCNNCDPFRDSVVTLNIPLVTLANLIKNIPDTLDWKENFVKYLLKDFKENFFQKRTVQELLWGYPDPFLQEYSKLRKTWPFRDFNLPEINPIIALQQNNTYQGVTTVYTGAKDISMLQKWKVWEGKTNAGVWNTSYANLFNGSDGAQFPPQQTTDSTLYVFVTQLCRSLFLTYDKPSKVHGIDTLSFTVPEKTFLNATLNPDNAAYCTRKCFPTGIMDIGVCRKAPMPLPLFVSAPHFYLGDKSLTQNVHGLSPNKKDHGTILEIETHVGISLKSAKRLQINVLIGPVEHLDDTEHLHSLFLPIMYINETSTIGDSQAKLLKDKVLAPIQIAHYIELAMVILGGVLFVVALILLVLLIRRNRKLKKIKSMLAPSVPSERSPLLVSS
ncbi:hypothetical protein QZH41_000169 [Actinostola sp. cb2023]|nr:hypothetical protein QZH41_000169 [Actinostola sp. cb2023]